jgi:glutathione peroxidase
MWGKRSASADVSPDTVYGFSFPAIEGGKELKLADFKGKVLLIVNTASNCGFTNQYEGLERLYERYSSRGLVVIGVPSNDFGGQEPGGNQEIANFCSGTFGVTFPLASKTAVKGADAHPFYVWAYQKLGFGTGPKWNFHKYLVNRRGELVDYFHSTTRPEADSIVKAIEKALNEEG